MSTYVIGDVHGCFDTLTELLKKIKFKEGRDMLWFAGDLVNRGPKSAEVLRFVMGLGDGAVSVLGNHGLNVLATHAELRRVNARDTMESILDAPDAEEQLDWLRRRPLAHRSRGFLMIHGGLHPAWDGDETMDAAKRVETRLVSDDWHSLWSLSKRDPPQWSKELGEVDRDAAAISWLIGARMVDTKTQKLVKFSGHPRDAPPGSQPWFEMEHCARKEHLIYGHWASLGLHQEDNSTCLDSGCVWGGELTALCLEDGQITSCPSLEFKP